jgi:multiple sugar transport system substrate-binding protein
MRLVHVGLAAIILIVATIAYLESRPDVSSFDAASHGEFKKAWIASRALTREQLETHLKELRKKAERLEARQLLEVAFRKGWMPGKALDASRLEAQVKELLAEGKGLDANQLLEAAFKKAWMASRDLSRDQLRAMLEPSADPNGVLEPAFEANWRRRAHITYWEKWGSFEAEACQAMVDEFNRTQEEIYCHYIRTSQVDRKAMLAIVGGQPPDLVGLWSENVPPFAEADALMPLDANMAASGLTEDHYIRNYLLLCQHNGKTWTLPTTPATIALFYNKDHYRRRAKELLAAGCDPNRPPQTIAELDRYADALSEFHPDGTPKVMGFIPTEPGWFPSSWPYYFGGALWNEQTGELTPDTPEVIRAFQWLKSYANRYGRQNLTRFQQGFGNYDSPQNAFIDAKVSMVLQGVYFPAFIDRHRPHLRYGVVAFPCVEGVPGPRSLMNEDVIGIPRGCPHPKEAWRFLHWVQTQGLPIICRLQGKHLPIRLPPEQDRRFRQGHPNRFLPVFDGLARAPHSFILPRSVVWREYNDDYRRAFDHVWHWPLPEEELRGLEGAARAEKVQALCRAEIVRTLRGIRLRMEQRMAQKLQRLRMRNERAAR